MQSWPAAAAGVASSGLLYTACNTRAWPLPLPLPLLAQRAALAGGRCHACAVPHMPATPALLCVPCLLRLLPALQVHIFSRNCEDRTEAYPDVTQQMLEATQGECALGVA